MIYTYEQKNWHLAMAWNSEGFQSQNQIHQTFCINHCFQCFSWVWGFCPSCPHDDTHFFVKSPYRLRPTCVPLCKARWKVPGVGTSARNGGAPKSWSRSFTTGATVSDGGVRVWLDFVWCQRTSAEIKIEIHSTSFNFGEKTGVQSFTKKRDCIFWYVLSIHRRYITVCLDSPSGLVIPQ